MEKAESKQVLEQMQAQFGEKFIWLFILVMPFIDMSTWKFPGWMHGVDDEQLSGIIDTIENNYALKALFRKDEMDKNKSEG